MINLIKRYVEKAINELLYNYINLEQLKIIFTFNIKYRF
jgi:hypothetical protein